MRSWPCAVAVRRVSCVVAVRPVVCQNASWMNQNTSGPTPPTLPGLALAGVDEAIVVRTTQRALARRQAVYADEVRRLLDAGLEVMRQCGTTKSPPVSDIVDCGRVCPAMPSTGTSLRRRIWWRPSWRPAPSGCVAISAIRWPRSGTRGPAAPLDRRDHVPGVQPRGGPLDPSRAVERGPGRGPGPARGGHQPTARWRS